MLRPVHQVQPVPYQDIDVEIRRLVSIINGFPGLRTIHSCAGHDHTPQTEVGFLADSQACLCRLVAALPFIGSRGRFLDRPLLESIHVTSELEKGCLIYVLRITGSPHYHQREILISVEDSLHLALGQTGTVPYCSGCA